MHEALHVAEQGLLQLPRYGPLWFCALRLQECTSQKHDLMRATRTLRGVDSFAGEVWGSPKRRGGRQVPARFQEIP